MSEICPKCGLPKPICVCETIAKESQRIRVYIVKKKFDKYSTIVEGLEEKSIDIKDVAKKLKSYLA
ncbi:MAG TPA: stress response translation initiation inhibitor YciH, partial [Candidatus Nanoarchaeia archaeon]|nr:stress response translation initiation inhibitor YciH [Candidatus Nanoarchaeia archaeon]